MGPDEYLWALMNDETQDISYRFRAAAVLLPFYCAKPGGDGRIGKKDEAAQAATHAGHGSEWSKDLDFEGTN